MLDHLIFQVGRDIRRSLVQPPAQKRVSLRLDPGDSGFYPVKFLKPPRMERDCITSLDSLIVLLVNFLAVGFPPLPPSYLFSRLNKPSSLCLFFHRESTPAPDHDEGLLLSLFEFINICLVLGQPKLNELEEETECAFQVMCNKCQVKGTDPFPQITGCCYSPVCCWDSLLPGHTADSCLPHC